MGKAQSKDSSAKVPDETDHARPKKQLVEVEEVFVQKIAYKCGVTEEELSAKKEVFRHVTSCNCTHVQSITSFCSGSTPAAPRPSASTSSRTCTGTSAAARRTSSSTSTSSRYSGQEIFCRERHFINILVRAFDTNKDDLLTFREWQVGFYLLLLLPSVKFFFELLIISFLSFPQEKHTDVSKEDFLLALEVSQTSLTKNIWTNIFLLSDNIPALWRGQQQPRDQAGGQADLEHHHPARVRGQVRLRRDHHHPGNWLRGPRQVRKITVLCLKHILISDGGLIFFLLSEFFSLIRYAGGVTQEEFLNYFSQYLKQN